MANTPYNIYVDGRLPPGSCGLPGGTWTNGGHTVLAITCKQYEERQVGPRFWYRLVDDDIYFNMEVDEDLDWWVGASKPDEATRFDFGGVLTHEIGHTVRLQHVPDPDDNCVMSASALITMCPEVTSDNNDTYWLRSLHQDDIESADYVGYG